MSIVAFVRMAAVSFVLAFLSFGMASAEPKANPGKSPESVPAADAQLSAKQLIFSAEPSEEEDKRPWRHLQRFQVHLREADKNDVLSLVGCAVDPDYLSCEDVEGAKNSNEVSGIKKVKSLKYVIGVQDWPQLVGVFTEALARANGEEAKLTGVEIKQDGPKAILIGPACEQFSQPCFSRPQCIQYSGCSKSQSSCVKCN
jgi:hypothetical protein